MTYSYLFNYLKENRGDTEFSHRFILRCKEKIGESARSPEAKSPEARGQAGRIAKIPHCTHKNTQIALLIFGNYAMISFGDKQVCASDGQPKTIVCGAKTTSKNNCSSNKGTRKDNCLHEADMR